MGAALRRRIPPRNLAAFSRTRCGASYNTQGSRLARQRLQPLCVGRRRAPAKNPSKQKRSVGSAPIDSAAIAAQGSRDGDDLEAGRRHRTHQLKAGIADGGCAGRRSPSATETPLPQALDNVARAMLFIVIVQRQTAAFECRNASARRPCGACSSAATSAQSDSTARAPRTQVA